tara:strand:- start:561 stop:737 length:177 start_codon:yes stop_codon:yes gene_type:complete
MKLAIIGGRDFSDFELMKKHLEEIKGDLNMKISSVISVLISHLFLYLFISGIFSAPNK